jgi:hypothetical protein
VKKPETADQAVASFATALHEKDKKMAHFAILSDTVFFDELEARKVESVVVVDNSKLLDENEEEQESLGIEFLQKLGFGDCVQTSYNSNFRSTYAAVDGFYVPLLDVFVGPQPGDGQSYTLDLETGTWVVSEI